MRATRLNSATSLSRVCFCMNVRSGLLPFSIACSKPMRCSEYGL